MVCALVCACRVVSLCCAATREAVRVVNGPVVVLVGEGKRKRRVGGAVRFVHSLLQAPRCVYVKTTMNEK